MKIIALLLLVTLPSNTSAQGGALPFDGKRKVLLIYKGEEKNLLFFEPVLSPFVAFRKPKEMPKLERGDAFACDTSDEPFFFEGIPVARIMVFDCGKYKFTLDGWAFPR